MAKHKVGKYFTNKNAPWGSTNGAQKNYICKINIILRLVLWEHYSHQTLHKMKEKKPGR